MTEKPGNVVNIFERARSVAPEPAKEVKVAMSEGKVAVQLGDELTTLATVKVLIKSLENLSKVYEAKVKSRMADEFAAQAVITGKRPMNFIGLSEKAEASCELRKRASNVALSEEEVGLLQAADVPIGTEVIQEAVPERYFFNPDIVTDGALAQKISAALSSIPELTGKEVVIRQAPRTEVVRKYVPEDAIDAVAATKDLKLIKEMLPIVSSLAIRVKLVSTSLNDAISFLKSAEVQL